MQECDVKFVLKKDFKEGNDNLFELIASVVMYDPKMMFFRLFANGISDDVKRVQYAFTIDSIIDIVNTIGISKYSVYVVEHVFGELFNKESTHYDFNALKKYNNEFVEFMADVSKKLEITIDEVISSFNKNKCE